MSVTIDYSLYSTCRKQLRLESNLRENSRFHCEECKEILLQPYQTECGFRYCYLCVRQFNYLTTCPRCDKAIPSMANHIIHDKAMEREILKLKIHCGNRDCEETFPFEELKNHFETICNERKENCGHCGESYSFKRKRAHLENECKKVLIKCDDCGSQLPREQIETSHRNMTVENVGDLCPKWRRSCPNDCCDTIFESIKSHLPICSKRPRKCILWNIGCEKLMADELLDLHIKTDEAHHLNLLTKYLLKMRSDRRDNEQQMSESRTIYISTINDIRQSTLSSSNQLSNCTKSLSHQTTMIKSLKGDLETFGYREREQITHNETISQTISSLHNVEFVWTIPNIVQRIKDAKNGVCTQMSSEPFYLTKPGYKVLLKIYPNGDGAGKNQYLSVFFVIVKGDYDGELAWPFDKRVRLCVPQNNQTISSTMVKLKPDINPVCYGKPNQKYNLASGVPNFIKIDKLMNSNEFVTEKSLRIRFNVEL